MSLMKAFFLSALAMTVASQVCAAPRLLPCGAASYIRPDPPKDEAVGAEPSWLRPTPPNTRGCTQGLQMRAGIGVSIWRCQIVLPEGQDFKEGQSEYAFLVQRDNAPLLELDDELMAGAFHNFELIKVDLDGNGLRENIIAAWNGQSNGIGIHSWTLHVFDSQWVPIKRFEEVADWGNTSLVAAVGGRKGCDIAITSYEESTTELTQHIVLRARFYGVTGPAIAPIVKPMADRPILERRLTNRLVRERLSWFETGRANSGDPEIDWQWRGDVAAWLNHPSTLAIFSR
jgi:hypothetical protein